MQTVDWEEFIRMLRYDAKLFRLDALPSAWPEWMTPEKRRQMADHFEEYANEVETKLAEPATV